ncbi:MAG TPA: hypothetical protein VEX15_03625 [Nocardioidaceae bacterium]|nr:hypothetical protein [Nocardioidaceae bacterium]
MPMRTAAEISASVSLYLAQVRPGRVEIYRDDSARVDAFDLPPERNLRGALDDHGWQPTGQRAAGGGWAAILVEPITQH